MNKFDKFLDANNNKFIKVLPNNLNPQCFDLAVAWTDVLDVPHFPNNPSPFPYANAYEIFTRPNAVSSKYFDFIPNSPNGVPEKGCIVVWDGKLNGGIGHVAVATGSGNTKTFQSFDQNWVVGSVSKLITHDYNFVLGWLKFKGSLETDTPMANTIAVDIQQYEGLVKKSTQFDKVCSYLGIASDPKDVMFEDIQKVIAGIKSLTTAAQSQLTALQQQLAQAIQETKNRDEKISRQNKELTDLQTSSKTATDALQVSLTAAKIDTAKVKSELEQVYKDKGAALSTLADVQAQLDACKLGSKPQPEVNTGGINAIIDWILKQFVRK